MRKFIQSVTVVVALASLAGCASASKNYVKVDTAVSQDILAFKAAKDARCDAGEIPASACLAVSKAFVPFLDAYLAVSRAIAAEAPIVEVDAAIAELKQAAVDLKDAISAIDADKRKLFQDLLEAVVLNYAK